jgi:REP element-mobilizing transposase RayT
MDQSSYVMDPRRREAVLAAIVERCGDSHWSLLAAHVRSNHVHTEVDADVQPERIMNDLKSYASRFLNRLGLDDATRKRWGAAWKYTLVVEEGECVGSDSVCC